MSDSRNESVMEYLALEARQVELTQRLITNARTVGMLPDQALINVVTDNPALVKQAFLSLADMVENQREQITEITECWLQAGDDIDAIHDKIQSIKQ